ncbi:MAG: hypothetical protein IJ242_00590 [Clostridia bacterium]|nr:hypothetical protein [Clostridia bacterium]
MEEIKMWFGSGKSEMRFPDGFFPAEGFVGQVHPLFVRAAVLEKENPFVLVSIEMTSLPDEEAEKLRTIAAASAGTGTDRVWITVTHTFSAPHIMPDFLMKTDEDRNRREALRKMMADGVRDAVREALAAQAECSLMLTQTESQVMASRDIELPEGWWIGCGGSGKSDRTLTVLSARQADALRAVIMHLNCQSSVLDGTGAEDGKCVSGDLAGIACAELEKRLGVPVIFVIGAAGDQAPVQRAKGLMPDGNGGYHEDDLHEAGVAVAETLGRQLADEAQKAMTLPGSELTGNAENRSVSFMAPAKKMNRNLHELKPSHTAEWVPDGEKETAVELLTVGELAVIGVKPELTYPTLLHIQEKSPFRFTLAATMVNGGAKYMADQSAYDRCMYEAVNSPFAPGAAELLEQKAEELLLNAK